MVRLLDSRILNVRLSRPTLWILLALWGFAMLLSARALTADPTGDGFVRGLNRVMGFLSWQLAGAVLSLGLWFGSKPLPKGDILRRLGRAPGWWGAFLFLAFVGFFLYSVIYSRIAVA